MITPESRQLIDQADTTEEVTLILQWATSGDSMASLANLDRSERVQAFAQILDAQKAPILGFLSGLDASVVTRPGASEASVTAIPAVWNQIFLRVENLPDVTVFPNVRFEAM